ncbi:MAG: flavodoxin family protein [Candidatus Methanoplasma sp.]|jgi:multimeric flavodoxin WrbA|nr:flavodoxin family protein [Candidatus Methanoplasma sp.]
MKALIICGSRKDGFTSEMCRSFSEGLAVHDVPSEIFFPIEMNIRHCTGCGSCSSGGICSISDDMVLLYKALEGYDLLVLASPIHFSGPSSAIKTVIDRFQTIWFCGRKRSAFAAALLSGGGASPNYNNTISIFKAFSITAKMEWLGHLAISGTDEKEIQDVSGPSFEYGKDVALKLIKGRG